MADDLLVIQAINCIDRLLVESGEAYGKKKKILIVEDDEFTRFMMRQIVKTLDVDVDLAQDGLDGIGLLSKNPETYGVILMDIYLPGLDGVESARRIRETKNDPPRHIPIIAVTSDTRYHDSKVVEEMGMNGFIPKPVTAGEVNSLIHQYCMVSP